MSTDFKYIKFSVLEVHANQIQKIFFFKIRCDILDQIGIYLMISNAGSTCKVPVFNEIRK